MMERETDARCSASISNTTRLLPDSLLTTDEVISSDPPRFCQFAPQVTPSYILVEAILGGVFTEQSALSPTTSSTSSPKF
jgi:hypothetical protein